MLNMVDAQTTFIILDSSASGVSLYQKPTFDEAVDFVKQRWPESEYYNSHTENTTIWRAKSDEVEMTLLFDYPKDLNSPEKLSELSGEENQMNPVEDHSEAPSPAILYVATFLYGGIIDSTKTSYDLDDLINYCKEAYRDGFNSEKNDCWITDGNGTGRIYFTYADYKESQFGIAEEKFQLWTVTWITRQLGPVIDPALEDIHHMMEFNYKDEVNNHLKHLRDQLGQDMTYVNIYPPDTTLTAEEFENYND